MYDTPSTIPPVHLLSQQSNVRLFIHHTPSSSLIPIVKCTTLHPHSPSSSLIPIVKCRTLHPTSTLFIHINSKMYDASSTIPPVHLLSQQSNVGHFIHHNPLHLLSQYSNVRGFIHHPPAAYTIPIVKCTTPHPPSRLFIYYPNSQMYHTSSTIPLFIYYPNSQCTTLNPPSRLFIFYPNIQMLDASSTMPPLYLLSQKSNVRHFIQHSPSTSLIPIVKCTTLHPQSPLFIYYPNSQMYDTSSTIPPVHLLSQQSNVGHFIHHNPLPLLSQYSNVRGFIHHPPLHLLSQQSDVPHFIHHPPVHLLSQQSDVPHFIHHPSVHLLSQQSMYDA